MATRMSVNPPQTRSADEVVTYSCGACSNEAVTDPENHVRTMRHDRDLIIDKRFLNYYIKKEEFDDRRVD